MRSEQEYLNVITAAFPCPASGYERAYWLYECRSVIPGILRFIDEEYLTVLEQIEDEGLTSERYEIRDLEKQVSHVNVSLLKKEQPAVFEELVHIKSSDAQKILGRQQLYQLSREKMGADAISRYESVNIADLERAMLPAISARYIEIETKIVERAVVLKDYEACLEPNGGKP